MKALRNLLDQIEPFVRKGEPLEKLYPQYEALDTFLFTPGQVTKGPTHLRDSIDLKRTMVTVIAALVPCIFMAMWNTGYQANLAMQQIGATTTGEWRGVIIDILGIGYNPSSALANIFHGFLYFFPIFLITQLAGGLWEVLFATVRDHEVNEGFLVTGMLFPLTLPPMIPLWQVAIGISFGVVLGKEVFGGTGKNFLNPALTGRAFLYFAYPAEITGDAIWVAVDGFTAATPLGAVAADGMAAIDVTWTQAFIGALPGSLGETSALACLIGAAVLIGTGIGSWRIMLSMTLSTIIFAELLHIIGSDTNPMFQMNASWHLVLGSFAFGCVFMATDPVSAAMTETGRWFYGALIGFMTVLIRVINPAYPEGIMLAILFSNVFAPLIDWFVVRGNIKRRLARNDR